MAKKKLKITTWSETAIDEYVSALGLFECDRESEEFAILARSFIGEVVECKMKSNAKYAEMGKEIMEAVLLCLKKFDSSQGDFVHYLNVSLKNAENKYARNDERLKNPISLPSKRTIEEKKLIHWLKEHDWPYLTNQQMGILSKQFHIAIEKIKKIYEIEAFRKAESYLINDDGDEVAIDIPYIEEGFAPQEIEDFLDNQCRFLAEYIKEYPKKSILFSAIMTNQVSSVVLSVIAPGNQRRCFDILRRWDVFHEDVYRQCVKKNKHKLQGQEMATLLEKDNATISRAKDAFHEYLRSKIKNE